MNYNPEIHHRRSIRLKDYDYSTTGAYFVTICSWNRECLFGDIADEKVRLNESGDAVMKYWNVIPGYFPHVETDEFIIMPNHIHGIIVFGHNVGAQFIAPYKKTATENQGVIGKGLINQAPTENNGMNQGVINHAPTVGEIVRAFKAQCTREINQMRNSPGFPVWQRNYYEHIIRNEDEMNSIREYLINNPARWAEDENNPANIKS